ncbi:MAG: RdgB/HAM1 family non-canonical purine NTP pyrophosphatase [Gammaproteobacteria bacterium]|nr:RdgB/HAM1 family non-canonical purine NTP pyrophosphatase [Gammaproteobacteria bacterium]
MKKIVLATGNAGKIREIASIFSGLDVEIVAQSTLGIDSPEETGDTFADNALLKARFAADQSGLPAMADDSGIVVDALGGRPGVRSARYAGENATDEENLDLLLEALEGVPDDRRGAGFHCAAVLAWPEEHQAAIVVEEVWRGRILRERRGSGGFGYDPVFLDLQKQKTGAEMSREEKNVISHRGKAFRKLRDRVQDLMRAG